MVLALNADMLENKRPKHEGSVLGHVLRQDKQVGHAKLMVEYFGESGVQA